MSLDLLYSLRLKRRHDLLLFCYAASVPSPGGQTQTPPQVTHNKEQSAPVETVDTTERVPRVDNKRRRASFHKPGLILCYRQTSKDYDGDGIIQQTTFNQIILLWEISFPGY